MASKNDFDSKKVVAFSLKCSEIDIYKFYFSKFSRFLIKVNKCTPLRNCALSFVLWSVQLTIVFCVASKSDKFVLNMVTSKSFFSMFLKF